jgi:hypothetical protein
VTDKQYAALSNFRFHLAKFLRFSQRAARSAGIMPAQYLLLLHGHPRKPLAERS